MLGLIVERKVINISGVKLKESLPSVLLGNNDEFLYYLFEFIHHGIGM